MVEEKMTSEPGFHVVKDSQEIRWLTGFEFVCILPEQFKQYAQVKRWCKENCEDTVAFLGRTQFQSDERLYFFSETDAMAFKLGWL